MNFTFIVPICIRNNQHLNQLERCVKSIRNFHPENSLYLINDSDDVFDIKALFVNDKNINIIKTLKKGSADQQVFKVIIDYDIPGKCFIMQDSMLINRSLENIETVKGVKFLWHYTNHILHWDNIFESATDYNRSNNIKTHTDLIKHYLNKDYSNNSDFLSYALDALENKNKWCGTLGNCCIIDKETIMFMNYETNFINKFINYTTNRERRVNESIFPLFCHYYFPEINFYDSYDGLYYDGIHENPESGTETGFDNLVWCCKRKYVSKISFNR
jgi:hypothetical protein